MNYFTKDFTVFYDIETSISADKAMLAGAPPIIQIAALAVNQQGEVVSEFETKIKFKTFEQETLDYIGYTKEAWENAILPNRAARLFTNWLRPYQCHEKTSKKGNPYKVAFGAGHNVLSFDRQVLFNWYRALEEHYNQSFFLPIAFSPMIDTLELVHAYQVMSGDYYKAALGKLADRHELDLVAHDALSDVKATLEVYKIYYELLKEVR